MDWIVLLFCVLLLGSLTLASGCAGRLNGLRKSILGGLRFAIVGIVVGAASVSHAVIPASERAALQALYTSTNGASWAVNTNWNGAVGTECTWFGVTCSSGDANVTRIDLSTNGLTGSLPAIAALTALERFNVNGNLLTGSVPALVGLSALEFFEAKNMNLTGSIPPLAGLANLRLLNLSGNDLTGAIPALTGLPVFQNLIINNNLLTGSIPTLTGSPFLSIIDVSQNNLSGSIPSLTGLTALVTFRVSSNQLTGSIPSLAGLNSLQNFIAQNNQLTGAIPALNGSLPLQRVELYGNQLSGPIPSLSGLIFLNSFLAFNNQLSGSIPALAGLTNLNEFDVSNNALTGSIPSLTGTDLDGFRVANNQLTGAVPTAPATLNAGESTLCPNQLTPSVSAAWDAATGQTPWSFLCGGSGVSFTVTPSAGANGAISPATPQTVAQGGSITFTTVPNAGFVTSTVGISGTCNLSTIAPEERLVSNVQGNCTFSATFAPAPANFTVTPSVISGNGTISPATPQTVASGATIAFTLTPDPGFILAGLQGSCSGNLVNNVFTSDAITADCTVGAVFAPDRNAQAVAVPTLNQWALLLLCALAGLLAVARVGVSRAPSLFHRHRK
jgi:Divergent InlB B-repeat domain/IPTL-CTERM motif